MNQKDNIIINKKKRKSQKLKVFNFEKIYFELIRLKWI